MPERSRILRKRFSIIILVLVALVGFIGYQVAKPREPLYKGKPLSLWLTKEYTNSNAGDDVPTAVRLAGTNGIPVLLRLLRVKDSALKAKVMHWAERRHIIHEYIDPEIGYYGAAYAFGVLGTNAHTAVPELIRIADDNISGGSETCAIESIESVGYVGLPTGEAMPALSRWATNSNLKVRSWARSGLKQIGCLP